MLDESAVSVAVVVVVEPEPAPPVLEESLPVAVAELLSEEALDLASAIAVD